MTGGNVIDSPEAPIDGEVDKWGFTIKPTISDNELIRICLSNAPCGCDKKQVQRLIAQYHD
ncbi:hypothetical protein SBM3_00163 [Synechococcus phage S-BM3]|nr:hypothetical protein SBM3_00163 [Synechococcus phage S-BM3]